MGVLMLKRRIEGIRRMAAQGRSEEETRLILQLAAYYARQLTALDTLHMTKSNDNVWRLN